MIRQYRKSMALCLNAGTLLVSLVSGYGRALAGGCSLSGGSYLCAGAADLATDTTINLHPSSLTISTTPTFGIDTSTNGGNAFNLYSDGGITFLDDFTSTIIGRASGILAVNQGSGDLSITTNGLVTGIDTIGIWAHNRSLGTNLTITAGNVSGRDDGINARNDGHGQLSITASGNVMGTDDNGIYALNNAAGTSLHIAAHDVFGGINGFVATNNGSGDLSISSTGNVTGYNGIGVWANNSLNGTGLTISAATVYGWVQGIDARNFGSGQLSITVSGVMGRLNNGIYALNSSTTSTSLHIAAQEVVGGTNGIVATNNGTGDLSISSTGRVSGSNGIAIWANNSLNGTNLNISAATAYASNRGIDARNSGSGNLTISTSGIIGGWNDYGIFAHNSGAGTNLTISAADVYGGTSGIGAINDGSGALSITSRGDVYGYSHAGILALNQGNGGLAVTSSGSVYGGDVGVLAANLSPSGAGVHISTGNVYGGLAGIVAWNSGSTVTIDALGNVLGGSYGGIVVNNLGSASNINVHGLLASMTGPAISSAGAPTTVNLLAGSSTFGDIVLDADNDRLNLVGSLTGSVTMNGGNDTFVRFGGSFLNGTIDGGDGHDTLGLYNIGTVHGAVFGTTYQNFENLAIFGGDNILTGAWDVSAGNTIVYAGNLHLNGSLQTNDFIVNNGGHAEIDGLLYSSSMTVGGQLDLGGIANTGTFTILPGGQADISGALNSHDASVHGSLNLNGNLTAETLTVASAGFLSGNGSVNGNLLNYGTISPGNSIGTLQVNGSAAFMPGSIYLAEISPGGASDTIAVNGMVSLNGGTVKTSLARSLYTDGRQWTILSATGGVSGRFSGLSYGDRSETIDLDLVYSSNSVALEIVRTPFASFGLSPAAVAVGTAFDRLVPIAGGSMAAFITSMDFDMTRSDIETTMEALSPEIYTSFGLAGIQATSVIDQALDRHQSGYRQSRKLGLTSGDPAVPAHGEWTVWTRALGNTSEQDGSKGYLGYDQKLAGLIIGTDRQMTGVLRTGIDFGYTDSDLDWDGVRHGGTLQGRHLGAYASLEPGDFYFDASLGFSDFSANASRRIAFAGGSTVTSADFNGDVWSGRLAGAYTYTLGNWQLGPLASLSYARLNQDGFSEQGADFLDYDIAATDAESLTGALGAHFAGLVVMGQWNYMPSFDLRWLHQFEDDGMTVTAGFSDYPSTTFDVTGIAPAADQGQLRLGLSAGYGKNLLLNLDYAVTAGDDSTGHLISADLSWKF